MGKHDACNARWPMCRLWSSFGLDRYDRHRADRELRELESWLVSVRCEISSLAIISSSGARHGFAVLVGTFMCLAEQAVLPSLRRAVRRPTLVLLAELRLLGVSASAADYFTAIKHCCSKRRCTSSGLLLLISSQCGWCQFSLVSAE